MCFFLAIPPVSEAQKMSLWAAAPHQANNEQERYGFTSTNALRSHMPGLR
jgi:hypothetical protein